jgi:hypothetical protein
MNTETRILIETDGTSQKTHEITEHTDNLMLLLGSSVLLPNVVAPSRSYSTDWMGVFAKHLQAGIKTIGRTFR